MLPIVSGELEKREDFGLLLDKYNLKGTAVEIGVDKADFSIEFLKNWPGHKFIAIDPWDPSHNYSSFIGQDRRIDKEIATKKLEEYKEHFIIDILQKTSKDASKEVENELDFVYVDGSHFYDMVKEDLYLWWPKIKKGGVLAGHDFNGDWLDHVRTAVIEFANENNLQIYYCLGPAASWYIFKE
jgi:hypothetical protein